MLALAIAAVTLVLVYIYKYYESVRRYPRGPTPLPLIGNIHQFDSKLLHEFLEKCQSEYGDVFTVFTPRPLVVLMSYETIKEALVSKGEDFAGRTGQFPDDMFMTQANGGVVFSQGEEWREQRRVAISILRDFGMGKNVMEAQVKTSIAECLKHLASVADKSAVDFLWPLQILVANVVNEVLFGYHYKFDDCKRLTDYCVGLTTHLEDMRKSPLTFLLMQFPSLARIADRIGCGLSRANVTRLLDHVRDDVRRCQASFKDGDEPECFVHAYTQRMRKNNHLNEEQMVNVSSDFFVAGMETTSTTLRWAMLHMANNLGVQDKIRAEIHAVLGRDGEVSMADRTRLPYTAAAVAEVQRLSNIFPLNLFHRTIKDSEVSGHAIPVDTIVMPQIFNVHKGELYSDADQFRPERYLMEYGKTPNKELLDRLVPFSMGKRACAGEGLARMELFLALVSILQKYRLLPPKDAPLDMSPVYGAIRFPKANKLQMIAI